MSVELTHECPKPGCREQVEFDRLACRQHWFELPKDLRERLWEAWVSGPVSEHAAVREECCAWFAQEVLF
jgi:hypothetical protein